jgi:hypothetical protein
MTDTVETEIENEEETTTNDVIRSMVDTILQGDAVNAQATFASLMSGKVADAIDNRRLDISQSLYSREKE